MSGQSNRARRVRWSGIVLGVVVCVLGPSSVAMADPAPVGPADTTVPPTTAPGTTQPGTTVPPVTSPPATAPSGTPTTRPGASTTTTPDLTTTTAPIDPDAEASGYASSPAPLIPNAASDPLFHAALTVDDDLRTIALGKKTLLTSMARAKATRTAAARTQEAYDAAHQVDTAARRSLSDSRHTLRAAALHAYTGYGSQEAALGSPEVASADKVLPYRTYVEVTIKEASQRVADAEAARRRTKATADAARAKNDSATATARSAAGVQRRASADLAEASRQLLIHRKALDDLIASMPDLAPGTLERLPKVVKTPPGATLVASPVGDIVVPAKADPRTAVALQFIVAQLGKPYVWGATGPSSYDCSGLTLRAFQASGVTSMPRVSQAQQVWATPVDAKDAQPGDLVFFGRPAYHVGVYIGGGLMMDAPFTGAYVRVDKVWSSVTSYGRPVWSTPAT